MNCQQCNIKTREKCTNLHALKSRVKINKHITRKRTRTWHEYRQIINVVISPPWWLICVAEWSKFVPFCRGLEYFLQCFLPLNWKKAKKANGITVCQEHMFYDWKCLALKISLFTFIWSFWVDTKTLAYLLHLCQLTV